MDRRADDLRQSALFHIDACVSPRRYRNVDHGLTQVRLDRARRQVLVRERYDSALSFPHVADRDARYSLQACAKFLTEIVHTLPDCLQTPIESVINRHPQGDLGRVVRLPRLEAARIRPNPIRIVGDPFSRVEIDEWRVESLDQGAAYV